MTLQENTCEILREIHVKVEEARMLSKCYPRLQKNVWFCDQLERLMDLALECEQILIDAEETKK